MAHPDLLAAIQKLASEGHSSLDIKTSLIKKGWSEEDINGGLAISALPVVPSATPIVVPVHNSTLIRKSLGSPFLTAFLTIVILCVAAGGIAYWYEIKTLADQDVKFQQVIKEATSTAAFAPVDETPVDKALNLTPVAVPVQPTPKAVAYVASHPVAKPNGGTSSAATKPSVVSNIVDDIIGVPTPVPTPTPVPSNVAPSPSPVTVTPDPTPTPIPVPVSVPGTPSLAFRSDASTINAGAILNLSWSSSDLTSCTASGDWNGSEPTSGSVSLSNLLTSSTFVLSCMGPDGPATQTVSVTVIPLPTPIPTPTPSPTPIPTPSPTPTPTPSPAPTSVPTLVAAGCAVPSAPVHSFYVDAVNGSDTTGDGSQAHPWQSLQNVITTKISTNQYVAPYYNSDGTLAHAAATVPMSPTGVIKPGDIIYLMSGNYGSILIGQVNSDFITIAAAPAQTPVLTMLTFHGSAKWIVEGIKVQSLRNGYNNGINISTGYNGPDNNIIINNNSISSQDDVSGWTQAEWKANALNGGIFLDSTGNKEPGCITVTNNTIFNVAYGAALGIDHTLFEGNTINNFGDDGLDYDANNLVITHNTITNNNDIGDGNHEDGMQGQIGRFPSYSNITIDGNTIIRQTNANLAFPTYIQGIDAFDSDWTNVKVTNNIVITDTYNGITFSSVHGGLIANNTVLNDGGTVPGAAPVTSTWIRVGDRTHEGATTTDMIVRNNISTTLAIGNANTTASNNVASQEIALLVNGATDYYSKAGTYGDGNVLDPNLNSEFVNFNPTSYSFNIFLLASSSGVGKGAYPTPGGGSLAINALEKSRSATLSSAYGVHSMLLVASVLLPFLDIFYFLAHTLHF